MTNQHRKRQAPTGKTRLARMASVLVAAAALAGCGDSNEDLKMTWFGISNWSLEVGELNMIIDGYMSRIPADYFSGGGGQLGLTKKAFPIDRGLVDKMHGVLAGNHKVKYLFTGHSHFDHSFDTPYWAKATGAKIIGSQSTCYQAMAMGVPKEQCTPVFGGEFFDLSENVRVYVVLWNHSGTHEQNPEQHDAVELQAPPMPDAEGNLRGGVAEDFPNGGGNRGFLFRILRGDRTLSMFFTNSGSTQDLHLDTVVNGKNYGSPLQSLSNAMLAADLKRVDLWIAGGGESVARYVVPIARPFAYIPNHLGDFFQKFDAGYDNGPFRDAALSRYLDSVGTQMLAPVQYMDRFDLSLTGVAPIPNRGPKMAFGFKDIPDPREAGVDTGPRDGASDAVVGADVPQDLSPPPDLASDPAVDTPFDLPRDALTDARDAAAAP